MTRRRSVLLASLIALTVIPILLVLSGSLTELTLAPGVASAKRASPGASISAPPTFLMFNVLVPLLVLFVIVSAIASIRGQRFRFELGIGLAALAIILIWYLFASLIHSPDEEEPIVPKAYITSTLDREEEGEESFILEDAPAPEASVWPIPLSLTLASILLVISAVMLVRRGTARRSTPRISIPELDELVEAVTAAADRIRFGEDAAGVVQRCYATMVKILSRRSDVDPTYLTPREFAHSLQRAGLRIQHVEQLTSMFELVRYGGRSDDRFAEQAIGCLDVVRAAYAIASEP